MERRLKTNPLQWSTFLDFAEQNPVILTKKFDFLNGKRRYDDLWKEISATLNSMGYLQKNTEKWQKAVADWKSKVEGKAADINKGLVKTGGGGPMIPLNENEKRLMAILGWSSVTGTVTTELGISIETSTCTETSASTREIKADEDTRTPIFQLDHDYETNIENVKISPPPLSLIGTKRTIKDVSDTPKGSKKMKITGNTFERNIVTRNMQDMHEETMGVLKEINGNLKQMNNTQQRLCNILETYFCPGD